GDLSMGELQDPFLVSVHLIADPGEGRILQRAADSILACVHPDLQLFRVSERAALARRPGARQRQSAELGPARQPALALILFLQEACGGEEEELLALRRALRRPPWRYHHTETVSSRRMLPLSPGSQDFFTLAPGTPLWALRQVHYGREIVRFTVYCQHQNYGDTVRLYRLLLRRRVWQRKEDFCFFLLYSNPRLEIQLSFKRLPPGRRPAVLESALLEVRVRDVGALVPLLPRPCSPISQVRWRTEDYDGNQILLQVQVRPPSTTKTLPHGTKSAPPTLSRSAAHPRTRRHHHHHHRAASQLRDQPRFPQHPQGEAEWWAEPRRSSRSGSLASLPHLGSASFRSTCSSPGPSSLRRSSSLVPPCRFSMDALVGAEETDVDTGDRVSPGGGVDLSVVSAYLKSSLLETSEALSAPPEDPRPSQSPAVPAEDPFRGDTLGRTVKVFPRVPSADPGGFSDFTNQGRAPWAPEGSDRGAAQSGTVRAPEHRRLQQHQQQPGREPESRGRAGLSGGRWETGWRSTEPASPGQTLAGPENGSNLVVSPWSVSASLGLLQLGARANTLAQLEGTLGYNAKDAQVQTLLPPPHGATWDRGKGLQQTCTLLLQSGVRLAAEFARQATAWANASVIRANLSQAKRSPEQAGSSRDEWWHLQAGGSSGELSGSGEAQVEAPRWDQRLQMALVDTVAFRGLWQKQFQFTSTQNLPFALPEGGAIKVPMMYQATEVGFGQFRTAAEQRYTVLELPFLGRTLSLQVVLPSERKAPLASLEAQLTAGQVASWESGLRRTKMDVFLPRFKIQNKFNLRSVLPAMGISDAFNPTTADFSGISGRCSSYVSSSPILESGFKNPDSSHSGGEALRVRRLPRRQDRSHGRRDQSSCRNV
ncbi:unnamed protein product, partial [Tetraodon nigroviridis]